MANNGGLEVDRLDKPVPIRELKSRLVAYLGQVREGETLMVLDRDRPLARVVPATLNPTEERLYALARQGLLLWDGGKPFGLPDQEVPVIQRYHVEISVEAEPSS